MKVGPRREVRPAVLSAARQLEGSAPNAATGKSLTSFATVTEKDLRVTDNGDGTLTILVLATGNAVLYGPPARRLPGTLARFASSSSSTRAVRSCSRRVVRESTGRSDDFCTAAVAALS